MEELEQEQLQQERPEPKNVFHNKNFTLTFLGALVSNIASLFYSFAVSFYILKITGNNAFIQGLYLAVGGGVFCIVTLFGGVISDRFNKAKIMYICDYLKGAVIIGFTLLLMFVIHSPEGQVAALFVVTILGNAIAGIFSPASAALLPQIVAEDSFQQAQSYFSILNSLQSIVGVILAGILYALIPINILFLIVGICYVLSGISEMFIRYDSTSEKRDEKLTVKMVFGDIRDGFRYLASIKALLAMMICILFINFFFSPIFDNFIPYFIATDVAGADYFFHENMAPEMWNSFFTVAFGIGSLVMGILLSMMKQKEKCNVTVRYSLLGMSFLMIASAVFYGIFKAGYISINAFLIFTIVMFLGIGILIVLTNVPSTTAMMKIIDKDQFGKVSSVTSIGSQGLIPVATFLGGLAITYITSLGLLIVCASGLLIVALILFFLPSFRTL
ncbi:MAG: MFS transporter [Bacilli bacterium]|nr:MFS transporter [Bacilli bacterium]